jgi:ATP-binding cassette subfamily A (ABC1) protein 3
MCIALSYLMFNVVDVVSHTNGNPQTLLYGLSTVSLSCLRDKNPCNVGVAPNYTISAGSPTIEEQQWLFGNWTSLIESSRISWGMRLIVFNSTQAMETHYQTESSLLAGMVLDSSQFPHHMSYDIRISSTYLPAPIAPSHPSLFFPPFSEILGGANSFSSSGFAALQTLSDSAIGTMLARHSQSTLRQSHDVHLDRDHVSTITPLYLNASSSVWPTSRLFSAMTLVIIPAYLGWAFLGATYLVSIDLVSDRVSKLKEYLKIMGMKESSYWLSYTIFTGIIILPPMLLLSAGATALGFFGPNVALGLLYILLFALTSIAFAMLVGAVAPSTQVASGAVVVFFTTPFIASILVNLPLPARIGLGLLAPINFQFSMIELIKRKALHQIGPVRVIPTALLAISEYPVAGSILIFLTDFLLYSFFAWYFAQILGGSDDYGGSPKPWYFLFTRSYWIKSSSTTHNKDASLSIYDDDDDDGAETTGLLSNVNADGEVDFVKPIHSSPSRDPAHFQPLHGDPNDVRVSTRGLLKRYSGSETNAVNGLDLEIFQGIYVLLGENGSGKSTTISMLTGLIPLTSGSAKIDGADLTSQLDFVRDSISICPQHDLLSDGLSGAEHLRLFGLLKGVPAEELEVRIAETLADVGLANAGDQMVETYSGGMKRSLSLGISLVANSRVIFIDEASSGMDMEKRRTLWDMLLRKKKQGSTLILTTHYMEEAEILGDRIGIMHRGNLVREGSLDFLKRELGYQIHTDGPKNQSSMSSPSSTVSQADSIMTLPISKRDELPQLLKSLENDYSNVAITTPNLEEVFVQLAKSLDTSDYNIPDSGSKIPNYVDYSSSNPDHYIQASNPRSAPRMQQIGAVFKKKARMESRSTGRIFCFLLAPIIFCAFGLSVSRISAGYMRELPTALAFSQASGDPISFSLRPALPVQIPFTSSTPLGSSLLNNVSTPGLEWKKVGDEVSQLGSYLWNGTDAKMATIGGYHFDGISNIFFSTYSYGIEFNQTDIYSLPRMINMMDNVIIHHHLGDSSIIDPLNPRISVRSIPFPAKEQADDAFSLKILTNNLITLDTQFGMLMCLVLAILGGLIGKQAAEDYEKQIISQLQRIGMSVSAYWVAGLFFDVARISVSTFLMIALVACFRLAMLQGTAFLVFAISALLQAWTVVVISIVFSKLFSTAASAQKFLPLLLVMLIIAPTTLSNMLRSFSAFKGLTNIFLKLADFVLLASPLTLLLSTLSAMATAYAANFTTPNATSLMKINAAGLPILVQFGHLAAWAILLFAIEKLKSTIRIAKGDEVGVAQSSSSPSAGSKLSILPTSAALDSIVGLSEEDASENQAILLDHIWKRYPGAKRRAVVDTTLAVPNGICFGLLGPNGAGKSTTISMLIGDIAPSGGQYYLNGEDAIGANRDELYQNVRLSCCLQTNSLFDDLTVTEHIHLYLTLRNHSDDFDLNNVTHSILSRMKLLSHAKKLSKQLSGGNKRKLCTAIAALTFNDIVVLDEPSTGCDPSMRRTLWQVLKSEQSNKGLILTTHSMDEADAVCNRLAIMVNGQIVSLGTPQALKAQCGGYELQIWLSPEQPPIDGIPNQNEAQDGLIAIRRLEAEVLQPKFPGFQLLDKDANHSGSLCLKYDIGLVPSISDTFAYLQNAFVQGQFIDYSLSQTTLGTAYQRLVRQQLDDPAPVAL